MAPAALWAHVIGPAKKRVKNFGARIKLNPPRLGGSAPSVPQRSSAHKNTGPLIEAVPLLIYKRGSRGSARGRRRTGA